jgi:hypothetical protein
MKLRQAAIVAGVAYLLNPVSYAEIVLYPKVVIAGNIAQTVHNINVDGETFVLAILCYLINFIEDLVIAWALYVLLTPVNQPVSLLTAWFRVLYTALGLFALLNLVTVYRALHDPAYAATLAPSQIQAQVELLLGSFRWGWQFSLLIFGIHLALLGYLIFRSGYIPRFLGAITTFIGVGWIAVQLRPYLYPDLNLRWFFIVGFAELLLPLWLLIFGWRIPEPVAPIPPARYPESPA